MKAISRLWWSTGIRSTLRTKKPYPVEAGYIAPVSPSNRDAAVFDNAKTVDISTARMDHLESLGLPLEGRKVLDVGAGVGHLAQYFVRRGCDVTCTDGRASNIDRMRELYPGLKSAVCDVQTEALSRLGMFDVVFCYGLLYHLESPVAAMRNMASVCREIILLETQVCDHVLPILRMGQEDTSADQALTGLGGRPSPSYVTMIFRNVGFEHIYAPKIPPAHPDFRFRWKSTGTTGKKKHPIRCVFVASRNKLPEERLVSLI
ncbi:MAG: class I SAM-dependent methyltransferase [Candidatus Acidiferrales bacterium]